MYVSERLVSTIGHNVMRVPNRTGPGVKKSKQNKIKHAINPN